jgi:hypothetical protein
MMMMMMMIMMMMMMMMIMMIFSAYKMGVGSKAAGIVFFTIFVTVVESIDLPSFRTIRRRNPYNDAKAFSSSDQWWSCFEDNGPFGIMYQCISSL